MSQMGQKATFPQVRSHGRQRQKADITGKSARRQSGTDSGWVAAAYFGLS